MTTSVDMRPSPRWRRLATFVCLFGWLVCALPGATRTLPLSTSDDRSTARITLPAGSVAVVLQSREPHGDWITVETFAAQPGPLVLNLPASVPRTRFRLQVTVEAVSRTKFPSSFYRGRHTFAPSQTTPQVNLDRMFLDGVPIAVADVSSPAADAPVEADIWKISGTTAYFFNQLRGLQVIDLSAPTVPRLMASLRMPAAGQDLYLLPSGAGGQDVLLVATEQSPDDSTTWTRLQVVRVKDGSAHVVQTARIAGSPQGSRLLGRRLFLCTTEWITGKTTLTDWLIPDEGAPVVQQQTVLAGSFATLAAGPDWLAVAMTPPGQWYRSAVSVFQLGETGLHPLTAAPVTLQGRVNDAYKIQWRSGVLTTITQAWPTGGVALTTWLETFQADGPTAGGQRLGNLELARGETLHATRFAGDKAYIVTFLRTDPLFVVDLADPANPVIAGHVEVPGWSTHIEPIGDKLFTVGWESGAVTASLFDVADPAAPSLLRRLVLTEGYSYSEANWDPQALQVIADAGLALVPITTYGTDGATRGVRLIDIDLAAGELRLRGLIPGQFEARRAALVGDVAVTLSQRNLATALIADRDQPAALADTPLAWPVNLVLPFGDRVLSVETGGSWGGGSPAIRISPLASPDTVLAEYPLAQGYVHDAVLREGRLYVLRETSSTNAPEIRFWRASLGQLHLDVYDAADPLALRLLGSCAWDAGKLGASRTSRLLWPYAHRPAVVLENDTFSRGMPMPVFLRSEVSVSASLDASRMVAPGLPWPGRGQPHLLTFDVTTPTAPTVGEPLPLGMDNATLTDVKVAAAGLVVVGVDQWRERTGRSATKAMQSELIHAAQVIDVPGNGAAGARRLIDLPGSLFAVAQLGRDGFLAYTRTLGEQGDGAIQVSACDGRDAYQVAQTAVAVMGPATADGRTLFCATGKGVERRRLTDSGNLIADGVIASPWAPSQLRVVDRQLLASDWRRLLAAPVDARGTAKAWTFTLGFNLEDVKRGPDDSWIVPMGDYGFELATP